MLIGMKYWSGGETEVSGSSSRRLSRFTAGLVILRDEELHEQAQARLQFDGLEDGLPLGRFAQHHARRHVGHLVGVVHLVEVLGELFERGQLRFGVEQGLFLRGFHAAYDEFAADAWEEALQSLKRYCESGRIPEVRDAFVHA